MQLLKGINITPFVRTEWFDAERRKEWEPKIQKAQSAYYQLEKETVKAGVRACTTRHYKPDKLDVTNQELIQEGLFFMPYRGVGCYQGFAHSHPPVEEGKPWNYYGYVARSFEDAKAFAEAENKGDHETIAGLLGYPECCSTFFTELWAKGFIDPVWQAAAACGKIKHETVTMKPSKIFTGLRYIGVRLVPHLPCSFDCKASKKMADQWADLGYHLSIPGMDDLMELLDLDLEWNCLKSIAEVTTPYFRIITNSVPCWPKYTIQVIK